MANEIKVTVTGEDEFSDVAEKAFAEARQAIDKFEASARQSADKVGRDFDSAFDTLGEASGGAEQKFIGLSDSITGTQDVMEGLRTGNVQVLATGLADLAGAGEALWASFGKVTIQIGKKIAAMAADTAATIANTAASVAHAVATGAASAATAVWTAAQWLLNAALTANPIGLVVLAIAGLVAALVLAWQHSETFRAVVTGAFNLVLDVVKTVWNWVSNNWPLLLAILTGPIGVAVLTITRHWDDIKAGASGVYQWIVDKFNAVLDFFTGLPGRITGAVGDLTRLLYDVGTDVIQGLIDGLRDKVGETVGVVTGIASSIKNTFTGAFGISSPSKVFKQYGEFIVAGLEEGLKSGNGSVRLGEVLTSVDLGQVPDSIWKQLMSEGWTGRAYDNVGAERLYAPAGGGYQGPIIVQSLDAKSAEEGVVRALEGARRRGLI